MHIRMLNADTELKRTFDSITVTPDDWKGWSCIHIQDDDLQVFKFAKELLLDAEMQLHVYLKNMSGTLFLAGFKNIYVFCKDLEHEHLEHLADNICDLINPNNTQHITTNIYGLCHEHGAFEENVVKASDLYSPLNSALYYFDKPAGGFSSHMKSDLSSLGKTKVLIVEDDPTTRWKFRKSLKGKCTLETARDVNAAFGAYKQGQPDIVFLDITLPDGSGYAVMEWILRNDPGAYIVMCSADDNIETKQKAINSGAKGYITKPFQKKNLMEYIEACPKLH